MKKLLINLLFIFSVIFLHAQTVTIGGKVYQKIGGRYVYNEIGSQQNLFIPTDTLAGPPGSIAIINDTLLYAKSNSGPWLRVAGGSGGISGFDSTNTAFLTWVHNNPFKFITDSTLIVRPGDGTPAHPDTLACPTCGAGSSVAAAYGSIAAMLAASRPADSTIVQVNGFYTPFVFNPPPS